LVYFIIPSITSRYPSTSVDFTGFWSASKATWLIIAGLILGWVIFKLGKLKTLFRQDTTFVGGETEVLKEAKVSGVEFYNTIKDIGILSKIYKLAQDKFFDIYDQGKKMTFSLTGILRYLHNGVLPTYIIWCLLGMVILFFVLF
jgi:hypothetical protein